MDLGVAFPAGNWDRACRVLPVAPSTYHAHAAQLADPPLISARAKRGGELRPEIRRMWEEDFLVYGARKVRRQLLREGFEIARCTVAGPCREAVSSNTAIVNG